MQLLEPETSQLPAAQQEDPQEKPVQPGRALIVIDVHGANLEPQGAGKGDQQGKVDRHNRTDAEPTQNLQEQRRAQVAHGPRLATEPDQGHCRKGKLQAEDHLGQN